MPEKEMRKWEPREMRMVSEYLAKTYPGYPSFTRVRLGRLHPDLDVAETESEKALLAGAFRRWADAIVITPTNLILIEAAIVSEAGDVSKLLLYEKLLPSTPEFEDYMDRDIVLELVVAMEDPALALLAHEHNIRVVVFCPDWIREYISSLSKRKQQAPKTAL